MVVHLTGILERDGTRHGRQQYRCADCGIRPCCDRPTRCTATQPGPFEHRWVPMGTGKPVIVHVARSS